MERQKIQYIYIILKKNEQSLRTDTPDFKTYSKTTTVN